LPGTNTELDALIDRLDGEVDPGADWTPGIGDTGELADRIIDALTARPSVHLAEAVKRFVLWARYGRPETDPEFASPLKTVSQAHRLAVAEFVLGLRPERDVGRFCRAAGMHRATYYKIAQDMRLSLGCDLRTQPRGYVDKLAEERVERPEGVACAGAPAVRTQPSGGELSAGDPRRDMARDSVPPGRAACRARHHVSITARSPLSPGPTPAIFLPES
jgi:hypothetical protein